VQGGIDVKITGLRVLVFAPRVNHHQEVPEYVTSTERQNGVALISTDEGITGVVSSEAGNVRQLARLWAAARDHVEGQDPFDRGKIASVLRRRFYWPQRVLGVLDYGLWDIAGKALGKPIYKLLGATREKVLAYGSTIHHSSDERFVETVLRCQEMGFRAVKLHPYCAFEDDLRLVHKVRQAVGDDFTLMIDTLVYPAPYTRDEAFRMGRALDELRYWWFEDPLPKTDLDGLAELTRECRVVQIRAADRVEHISEYAAMVKHRCMDIMAGPASFGITDLMKLAALAEANNMKMEPHDFGGGTASLHVLLAITNGDYYEQAVPEGCFDTELYPGVYLDPIRVDREGYVHAPSKPGLGFEIDLAAAEKVASERL
jgi:L-alanine-DL-glutamate epimerase-like enolase superfamily enzyme